MPPTLYPSQTTAEFLPCSGSVRHCFTFPNTHRWPNQWTAAGIHDDPGPRRYESSCAAPVGNHGAGKRDDPGGNRVSKPRVGYHCCEPQHFSGLCFAAFHALVRRLSYRTLHADTWFAVSGAVSTPCSRRRNGTRNEKRNHHYHYYCCGIGLTIFGNCMPVFRYSMRVPNYG